jgi:phosphate:Na+ symporter
MTPTLVLLQIVAGVCLFLYGIRQVRRGIMRGFGAGLRRFVAACTAHRVTGFLAGVISTMILQSAGAVTMIMATFLGQKILPTAAALAVVIGADVGVAIMTQILTFDLSWLGPVFLLAGFILLAGFEHRKPIQNVGLSFFGLGLMLFALGWIAQASLPIKESAALPIIMRPLEIDPVLTLIVAALLTWMLHSSLAFVMLVVSFVSVGAISTHLAFQLILGANIGNVLIPLMATLRDQPAAVRLPFANLLMRLVMVLATLPFLDVIYQTITSLDDHAARAVVHFHLAFNLVLAIVFLPLTRPVAWIAHRLIPDRVVNDPATTPMYLDYKQMETPVVALAAAARETLRMADMVQEMMVQSLAVFKNGSEAAIKKIQEQDTAVDLLHRAIKHYMARTMELSLGPKEAARHLQIINFATTLEHIGDAIDKSMMPMAARMVANNRRFSDAGMAEIETLFNLVIDSLRNAQTVFMTSDKALARKLVEEKEQVIRLERLASTNHFARLSQGVPESIETSSVHLDLLRDLQRINGDLVTVAYPILEASGELLPNRLTSPKLTSLEPEMREEG